MNNSIQHSARIAAPVEQASDSDSTPSTSQWMKFSAGSVRETLRQIPNPAYYLTSAPGRVLTLLALAGRGLSCDTVADVTAVNSNVRTTGYDSGAAIHPLEAESAWAAELDDQHNPQDDDIISRENAPQEVEEAVVADHHLQARAVAEAVAGVVAQLLSVEPIQ